MRVTLQKNLFGENVVILIEETGRIINQMVIYKFKCLHKKCGHEWERTDKELLITPRDAKRCARCDRKNIKHGGA